jgi:hypothetical protein
MVARSTRASAAVKFPIVIAVASTATGSKGARIHAIENMIQIRVELTSVGFTLGFPRFHGHPNRLSPRGVTAMYGYHINVENVTASFTKRKHRRRPDSLEALQTAAAGNSEQQSQGQ